MVLPVVLVPGLLCSPRLYADQLPELWRFGPVTIADHTRHDRLDAIAAAILAGAPPQFALAGLSMGGYIAFEMVRQAPERVLRLALLDTSARPETPAQTERRRAQIELAESGRFGDVADVQWPTLVAPDRQGDERLREAVRAMAMETGAEAFVRQERAIIGRPDSRPGLASIRCPTLVLVGELDQLTPPEQAAEMAAGIAGARMVTIAGCGHLSTMESPAEVTRELARWLAD